MEYAQTAQLEKQWAKVKSKKVLTPGEMAKMLNPSSAYACAYCTVNMFRAALEILYDGVGEKMYLCVREIEPTSELLKTYQDINVSHGSINVLVVVTRSELGRCNVHIDHLFLFAFIQ